MKLITGLVAYTHQYSVVPVLKLLQVDFDCATSASMCTTVIYCVHVQINERKMSY